MPLLSSATARLVAVISALMPVSAIAENGTEDQEKVNAKGVEAVGRTLDTLLGYQFEEFVESFYLAQREITTPHPHSHTVKTMAGNSALEKVAATLAIEKAGALVYKLTLSPIQGMNVEFYDGGYLVAPATGGVGSLILTRTSPSGEKTYALAHSAGTFFLAVKDENVQAAFRAHSRSGSSSVSYLLIGSKDYTHLIGSLHLADPEDGQLPAEDGSIGVMGLAKLEAFIERERTRVANEKQQGVATVIAALMRQLEAGGWESEGA